MKSEKKRVVFLQKIGKIEFILFAFTFAGAILNTFDIKGGKLVLGLGMNSFALLYVFVALAFRRIKIKNQFDHITSIFSYLLISILIIGILFTILNVAGIDPLIHFGLISVLSMMLIIQIRKFKIGKMSSITTSLLYRLMIFWVVGILIYYILPGTI
jgi:hypothetical protein